jgi:hypothetical protein
MSKILVPILAEAIREYYDPEEILELCSLFDSEIEWDHQRNKPAYLRIARRFITEPEQGNNRRILDSLIPSLLVRCSEMVAKTSFERQNYHIEMEGRLNKLRPLLENQTALSDIAIPDDRPFTAKSEIRDLVSNAEGPVFLVDAYVGVATLDCLRPVTHPIRVLTGQQKQSVEQGFDTAVKDFRAEGRSIEVRRHPKLHDRYLIFNNRCWLIGSSVKDAGKKALNVIECLDSKQAVVLDAEKKWTEAIPYL